MARNTKTDGYLWNAYTDKPAADGSGRIVSGLSHRTMVGGYVDRDAMEARGRVLAEKLWKRDRHAAAERVVVWVDGYRPTGTGTSFVSSTSDQASNLLAGIADGSIGCRVVYPVPAKLQTLPMWVARAMANLTPVPPTTPPKVTVAAKATVSVAANETTLPAEDPGLAIVTPADHGAATVTNIENYCREHDLFDCWFAHGTVDIDVTDLPADDAPTDRRAAMMARITQRAEARRRATETADATAAANRAMVRGIKL